MRRNLRSIVTGHRALALLGAVVLAALLTMACGLLGLPSRSGPPTPTPTSEALERPSPTPEIKESGSEVVTPTPGVPLIDGRPYLRDKSPGAVIYYEPTIEYRTVEMMKEGVAATLRVLEQELGAPAPESVAVLLSGEEQFTLLASAHGFPPTAYVLGFYSPSPQQGIDDAASGVYLNADNENLLHTLGHELTHAAVPGLPSWFSEGLADYIGTRVEMEINPSAQLLRVQVFRRLVRNAVNDGALLDQVSLESFDLWADHPCLELDRFYGQVWQLMEYISRAYGPSALRGLVASYRDATQSADRFNAVLGIPVETLWQRFSTDITENLTAEERVDQSLDSLQRLAGQAEAMAREWNQVIAQPAPGRSEGWSGAILKVADDWDSLAQQAAVLPAPGPASSIRDLWYLYFQSMAQAARELAKGNNSSASQSISTANLLYSQASVALSNSLRQRPVLTCG